MTAAYDLAQLLPHRPPFLLVDRITSANPATGVLIAERLITCNDPLPSGHLPETLVTEALCQAAACLNGLQGNRSPHHRGYLVAIQDLKFQGFVSAGQTLRLLVEQHARLGHMTSFRCQAETSASSPVAQGRLLFAVTLA